MEAFNKFFRWSIKGVVYGWGTDTAMLHDCSNHTYILIVPCIPSNMISFFSLSWWLAETRRSPRERFTKHAPHKRFCLQQQCRSGKYEDLIGTSSICICVSARHGPGWIARFLFSPLFTRTIYHHTTRAIRTLDHHKRALNRHFLRPVSPILQSSRSVCT